MSRSRNYFISYKRNDQNLVGKFTLPDECRFCNVMSIGCNQGIENSIEEASAFAEDLIRPLGGEVISVCHENDLQDFDSF